MDKKRALVVDDSKIARITLRQMLHEHEIDVDTVESAEDALEYLREQHPNVIFMDHMMPGMDGFQAVREIKKDPTTATIPIVMYTSKEGEVYVGQARALGAIDVLPKQIEQTDLMVVLTKLNLVPSADGAESASTKKKESGQSQIKEKDTVLDVTSEPAVSRERIDDVIRSVSVSLENKANQSLLSQLLDDQRKKIKQDLLGNTKIIVAQVVRELYQGDLAEELSKEGGMGYYGNATAGFAWIKYILLASVVAVLALLYFALHTQAEEERNRNTTQASMQLKENERKYSLANEQNIKLIKQLEQENQQNSNHMKTLIETLEWAVNLNNSFDYHEIALGDERISIVQELATQLSKVGFKGTLKLAVHVGEFCFTRNEYNELIIPKDDLPIENCEVIGQSQEDSLSLAGRQSLAFASFLSSSPLVNEGNIRIELVPKGKEEPMFEYPAPSSLETSGDWNKIAKRNNRVEISIVPSVL